ncbi:glutamate--cysteine ligase [Teredinibacter purpureus]|uniref:glutamate--cysteine ligase n=1 Tax=Teredinibacter purpureus TaxID=2731756 RepID=UPI0005F81615|nr:glutamate--cysteine ligase [Teredinibacter purpureus]
MLQIKDFPKELAEPDNAALLTGILRGAERESLRVTANGALSKTDHPSGLGSALTHPQITTDFSEALLEFITPPCHTIPDMLGQLDLLQRYTANQLPEGEMLWTHSMPCALGPDQEIPVARYGSTNNGRMKTVYRVGLGHRYGRSMQTVAGLHYNFSLPNAFWAFLSRRDNSMLDLQEYKNQRYFGLIRNFRRHYWLLIYLFGASPALCTSFVDKRMHDLQLLDNLSHTLHTPFATSLRMGDLGYQSSAQEDLYVCYNDQKRYIETLCAAITSPHADYEALGITDEQHNHLQLNTGLLQIENEFYSAIRPKRTAQSGETALAALDNRGVEYIEVRCLDIDPFSPVGITDEQIRFLDTFLLYCALQESPDTDSEEAQRILRNQKQVVVDGRNPSATLENGPDSTINLQQWGLELLNAMAPVAGLLDNAHGDQSYSNSLAQQTRKLKDPSLTPSARILSTLKDNKLEYAAYALQHSAQYDEYFKNAPLSPDIQERMENMALESEAEQRELERKSQIDFDDFLVQYYKQYRRCCGAFRE